MFKGTVLGQNVWAYRGCVDVVFEARDTCLISLVGSRSLCLQGSRNRTEQVCTTPEKLTEELYLVGSCAGREPLQWFGSHGSRNRIKRRKLVSKRGDSGVGRGTLRFDLLEAQHCPCELCDELIPTCSGRARPRLLFAGGFHSNISAIQIRIASQRADRPRRLSPPRFPQYVCVTQNRSKFIEE